MTASEPGKDSSVSTGNETGFTLLEVMVAMAVLAIVLATVFKLQSSTINLSEAAHFKGIAPFLAQQQISALEQNGFDPDDLSKEFEGSYWGYTWSCDIQDGGGADWEDILSEQGAEGLKKIQIIIYSPNQTRSFALVTWRYENEE